MLAGLSLCRAHAAPRRWFLRRVRVHRGAGHRRKRNDLQRRECASAATPAIPGSRTAGVDRQ